MYPNYPPNPSYPPQQAFGAGYPPQQPGYPPQQPGYPPQQPPGYPPQQQVYPPQQAPGYPPQQQGYPPQSAYPPNPQDQQSVGYAPAYGYPPQQASNFPPTGQPGSMYPPTGQMPVQHQPIMQQQVYSQNQAAPSSFSQQPRPTVVSAPNFDASNDAAILRKAMKGFGTDEDAIINVLCHRTNAQRMEICRAFKTGYGKDLIKDIKSETKNNFEKILVAMLTPLTQFYCEELHEAMAGVGTDEEVLIETLCSLPNNQIYAINHFYASMYGMTLEDHLKSESSGCFKRLMVSLVTGGRDESMRTDVNQAMNDAQVLRSAGVGRVGTDESEFNRILCTRNFEQLKLIAQEYQKLTGNTLEKDIKSEFSGDIEDGLVAILRCAIDRPTYFAKRLHNSMAGMGTDDRALIRLVITRCEIDMVDIKEAFQRKYGKTLKSFIKGDTSGDYKHALYALIGEDRS